MLNEELKEAAAKISDILKPFENEGRISISRELTPGRDNEDGIMRASFKTVIKIITVVSG